MSSSDLKLENFHIPLEEIKLATDNFSDENYIGSGGFGKVYRGKLSDCIAAIKRLDPKSYQGKDEFLTELTLLSGLKNKNIITFIGYCDDDGEMIIVYEYAHNQSLDHHLQNTGKICLLNWVQRLKICIGAARGLDYLHSGLGDDRRIIHRDVKSSNILLDENLEAKISDFGLSKVGPRNQQQSWLHTGVAGTSCYLDPYYLITHTLTKESDVYSFGVVLFEMLCGQLVYSKDGSIGLLKLVQVHEGDEVDKIIDPHLKDQIEPISVRIYTEIAYTCIQYNYKKRPMMDIVIKKLEEALESQEIHELERLIQGELSSFIYTEIYNERVDKGWEERMLLDYKKIIERSDAHKACNTAYEIYSLLSRGILMDGGNMWFCLSKLNGKNHVAISAMELFKKNKEKNIDWKAAPESRFVNVSEFQHVRDLCKIKMQISIRMLSLETTYAIYLIYRPLEGSQIRMNFIYGRNTRYCSSSELRDDGWIELELCHFTNHLEVARFKFDLKQFDDRSRYGLYVEGIEFRPIDMVTEEGVVEEIPKSELDIDWELMLPDKYEEIIKRSNGVLHYTSKKQLYYLLAQGVFIDDNLMWFWLDTSNHKICILISSKLMTIKHDGGMSSIEANINSRSAWVMKVSGAVKSIEVGGEMKVHMLSPKTPYAAWLVFKCDYRMKYTYGYNIAWLILDRQQQKTRHVHLGDSSEMIRPLNDPEAKKGLHIEKANKKKLDRRPRERDDGWMEVELFPFFNDMDAHDVIKVGLNTKHEILSYSHFKVKGIEFRPQGN